MAEKDISESEMRRRGSSERIRVPRGISRVAYMPRPAVGVGATL